MEKSSVAAGDIENSQAFRVCVRVWLFELRRAEQR
jgi:hypothetical protein